MWWDVPVPRERRRRAARRLRRRRGDSWGIKHAFKLHDALDIVSLHGDVDVEVCVHDNGVSPRMEKSRLLVKTGGGLSEDCLLFVLEDFSPRMRRKS